MMKVRARSYAALRPVAIGAALTPAGTTEVEIDDALPGMFVAHGAAGKTIQQGPGCSIKRRPPCVI